MGYRILKELYTSFTIGFKFDYKQSLVMCIGRGLHDI